jgi:hypothetical protein
LSQKKYAAWATAQGGLQGLLASYRKDKAVYAFRVDGLFIS